MTEEQKAHYREYLKEWRKNNKDKIRANTERYWERKAARMKANGD